MKQFITVLKFELNNYFKSKGYMIATFVLALLLGIGLFIPAIIGKPLGNQDSGTSSSDNEATAAADLETWGIYDKAQIISDTISLTEIFPTANINLVNSEEELRKLVTSEEVKAGFILNSFTDYTYLVNNTTMYDSEQTLFQDSFSNLYRYSAFTEQGIDYNEVMAVINEPITSTQEILGKDGVGNYFYAYILVFIIYFIVILYGQMIATSVTSEKSNRAIEVLVTSTSSNSLIFGKVIAGAIASIFQIGLILGTGLISYQINQESWGGMLDIVFDIPTEVLITFILFGLFGYLLCAFIYGALGALVSKTEDISKSTTPIMIIILVGFFIAMVGMGDGDMLLVKITSFIPFTSFYTMIVRVAVGTVQLWEIIVSFILLLLTNIGVGLLAAKIYRMGTLRYGNPIKLSNALKSLKHEQ